MLCLKFSMDDQIKQDEKWNYNEYEILKRSVQFIFLISVFCLCAWLSGSFNGHYFSTCFLSMLANTLERKYMFLICNLILAFLANTFDHLDHQYSPPSSDEVDYTKKKAPPILVEDVNVEEEIQHEPAVSETEGEGIEPHTFQVTLVEAPPIEEEEEEVDDDDVDEEEEGEDEDEDELEVMVKGDDEVVDKTMATNDLEMASTEELNRKFEEFIRKMKEEIRIEPQRHPIAV